MAANTKSAVVQGIGQQVGTGHTMVHFVTGKANERITEPDPRTHSLNCLPLNVGTERWILRVLALGMGPPHAGP